MFGYKKNYNLSMFLTISLLVYGALANGASEYGSYVNLHPRPYEKCPAQDLIKLSSCCNDVLSKLDDCKADDLACECCALQSMKPECYNLCPGNPSNNFLTVLYQDCESLNDINACSIPFKKEHRLPGKGYSRNRSEGEPGTEKDAPLEDQQENSVVVKSKLSPKVPSEKGFIESILNEDEANGEMLDFEQVETKKETSNDLNGGDGNSDTNCSNPVNNNTYNSSGGNITTAASISESSSHAKNFVLSITLAIFIILIAHLTI